MPLTVPTKVLARESGVPVRQIQTWTDAGVLKPDEGTEAPGRGGSRHYPAGELDIAKMLGALAHKGMSATEAHGVAATLRPVVRTPEDLGFKGLEQARQVEHYLIIRISGGTRRANPRYKIQELIPR